jgi:hypothetical protein
MTLIRQVALSLHAKVKPYTNRLVYSYIDKKM